MYFNRKMTTFMRAKQLKIRWLVMSLIAIVKVLRVMGRKIVAGFFVFSHIWILGYYRLG